MRCFINGLKEEVKKAVQIFQPTTMPQTFCLAQLQEKAADAMTRKAFNQPRSRQHVTTDAPIITKPFTPFSSTTVPIKRITPTESGADKEVGSKSYHHELTRDTRGGCGGR